VGDNHHFWQGGDSRSVCFAPIADIGEYSENRSTHRPEHEADKDEEERLKKVAKHKPDTGTKAPD
jgi:hypothetical protein